MPFVRLFVFGLYVITILVVLHWIGMIDVHWHKTGETPQPSFTQSTDRRAPPDEEPLVMSSGEALNLAKLIGEYYNIKLHSAKQRLAASKRMAAKYASRYQNDVEKDMESVEAIGTEIQRLSEAYGKEVDFLCQYPHDRVVALLDRQAAARASDAYVVAARLVKEQSACRDDPNDRETEIVTAFHDYLTKNGSF
jgi:hypothetical protein